jgi:hypothetical protein
MLILPIHEHGDLSTFYSLPQSLSSEVYSFPCRGQTSISEFTEHSKDEECNEVVRGNPAAEVLGFVQDMHDVMS